MPLTPGTHLGGYEIIALLGAGAMGEVYRARETRLGRDVALKVLPPEFRVRFPPGQESGPDRKADERRARFEREALALASLNHPNIAHIYGIVEAHGSEGAGFAALVMELVEGQTLADAIPPSGMPPARVLDIALELADALAAAHGRGVVHRDLKPSNVMLRTDGHVTVLDFGVAKVRAWEAARGNDQPTALETVAGALIGTPAYMAPEQIAGRPADARSDLFALGVLLYQAATGDSPFSGDSPLAVLSSIVGDMPAPLAERRPGFPPALAAVIARLLEKDPNRRFQSAAELRAALETIRTGNVPASLVRHRRLPRGVGWVGGAAALIAAAVLAAMWLAGAGGDPPVTIGAVIQVTSEAGTETHPGLSPDGNWVAYAASGEIYLRRVGAENPVHLTADMPLQASDPAFSPDGRLIAFSARRDATDVRGGVWLMEVTGAAKTRVTEAGFSPAWSPDAKAIAYATEMATPYERPRPSQIWIADVASGQSRTLGSDDMLEPSWSPSGRRLAYWNQHAGSRRDIWTRPANGGEPTPVTDDPYVDWNPVWSHDGRHLFFCSDRSGTANVWRVRIDEESGRVLGQPEAVTMPASVVMRLSFSADGSRFAYEASNLESNVHKIAFDPVAGTVHGAPVPLTSGARVWLDVDVSVDGRLVFRSSQRQEDVYVADPDGGHITPLAPDSQNDRFPRWSPDGTRIAFSSTKGGEGYEIHTIHPDGSSLRRVTSFEPAAVHFPIWSPDGRRLLFTEYITAGGKSYAIDPDAGWPAVLTPLLVPPGPLDIRYRPWSWSPDGRHIAAYSERGAGMIVYDVATGAHETISKTGSKPRWLSDSRRLVYMDDGALRLMDARSKESREIYRAAGATVIDPAVSADDRFIYFILRRDEGNIWVATLE